MTLERILFRCLFLFSAFECRRECRSFFPRGCFALLRLLSLSCDCIFRLFAKKKLVTLHAWLENAQISELDTTEEYFRRAHDVMWAHFNLNTEEAGNFEIRLRLLRDFLRDTFLAAVNNSKSNNCAPAAKPEGGLLSLSPTRRRPSSSVNAVTKIATKDRVPSTALKINILAGRRTRRVNLNCKDPNSLRD